MLPIAPPCCAERPNVRDFNMRSEISRVRRGSRTINFHSARDCETFPRELYLRLKHMIVSHHGEHEFGSPKVPMTLEAVALHFLDNLDAKMHTLSQLMREDANSDSAWTPYQASLGRKLFKGAN